MSPRLRLCALVAVLATSLATSSAAAAVPGPPMAQSAPAGPQTPGQAPDRTIQRHTIRMPAWTGQPLDTWLVFDLIADRTLLLLKLSNTDGLRWWDHPLLSSLVCRIVPVAGGERLVDCQRVAASTAGEELRFELPEAFSSTSYLLTFTWQDQGREQEDLIRFDKGLTPYEQRLRSIPERARPAATGPTAPEADSATLRYRVRLSTGSAWSNLKPESWLILDVTSANTITLKHSTNAINLLTGLSRWWDHPVLSVTACPLPGSAARQRRADCLVGSRPGPEGKGALRVVLPAGEDLHDYSYAVTWEENGRLQQAECQIDRMVQPTPVQGP